MIINPEHILRERLLETTEEPVPSLDYPPIKKLAEAIVADIDKTFNKQLEGLTKDTERFLEHPSYYIDILKEVVSKNTLYQQSSEELERVTILKNLKEFLRKNESRIRFYCNLGQHKDPYQVRNFSVEDHFFQTKLPGYQDVFFYTVDTQFIPYEWFFKSSRSKTPNFSDEFHQLIYSLCNFKLKRFELTVSPPQSEDSKYNIAVDVMINFELNIIIPDDLMQEINQFIEDINENIGIGYTKSDEDFEL